MEHGIMFVNDVQTMVLTSFNDNSLLFLNRTSLISINYRFIFRQLCNLMGPHGMWHPMVTRQLSQSKYWGSTVARLQCWELNCREAQMSVYYFYTWSVFFCRWSLKDSVKMYFLLCWVYFLSMIMHFSTRKKLYSSVYVSKHTYTKVVYSQYSCSMEGLTR